MKEFSVKSPVPLTVLNDIIITALEGGSNYWYLLKEDADTRIRKYKGQYVKEIHGESSTGFHGCFSEAVIPAVVVCAEYLPIHDIETKEKIGELSAQSIQAGIDAMIRDKRPEVVILLSDSEDYDAGDADVIFQYFCLGSVIYG